MCRFLTVEQLFRWRMTQHRLTHAGSERVMLLSLLVLATTATATLGALNLTSQLKKLQDTIEQKTKIEIGDIVQIRGYVHTYREEREICVTTYCKHKLPLPNWLIFWVCVQ